MKKLLFYSMVIKHTENFLETSFKRLKNMHAFNFLQAWEAQKT
eukprot:UN21316